MRRLTNIALYALVIAAFALTAVAAAATIRGTAQADVLRGTARADTIYGQAGNDRIFGFAGNDRIYPGAGTDTVACGPGVDRVFADARDRTARDCEIVTRPKPAPAPSVPARVVVEQSGIASRLSSIGSYFSGYGVVLRNTSADEDARDVSVLVNVLDSAGRILQSESDLYDAIPAGATYYAGGMTITDQRPARLEITIQVRTRQKKSIATLPPVANVRVEEGFGSSAEVVGEFSNPYPRPISNPRITFVCFDGSGRVIGGGYTYPPGSSLPPGGRVGFRGDAEGLTPAQIASVQVSVEPDLG